MRGPTRDGLHKSAQQGPASSVLPARAEARLPSLNTRSGSVNVMFVTLWLSPLRATFPSHFNYLPFPPGGGGLLSKAHTSVSTITQSGRQANPQTRRAASSGGPNQRLRSAEGSRRPKAVAWPWPMKTKSSFSRQSNEPSARAKAHRTSSGSTPLASPVAPVVIFSTLASACRSNSSQRRFKASPRS